MFNSVYLYSPISQITNVKADSKLNSNAGVHVVNLLCVKVFKHQWGEWWTPALTIWRMQYVNPSNGYCCKKW